MTMKVNHKENLTLLGLISLVLISTMVLALPKVSADDIVTDVSITVPAVCSITTNANNNTEHSAIVDPGTYESNIGKTTIKTICNDAEGFSIYAIGYTNEEYGNTTLKPVTLDATQNSIITGTATTAGNPDTSNWAMKVSPVTGTYAPTIESDTDGSFSDYHKVPSTYTKVATKTSNTDITTGSSIEITYSAYIAGTQPADLYNGKVKFTMVHPANHAEPFLPSAQTTESGKICYYPNTDEYEGTMGCQEISDYAKDWSQCTYSTDYETYCRIGSYSNAVDISTLPEVDYANITLLASNFSRNGYGFAGWSDNFDYATNNTAKYYGPNETISIPDTSIYTGEGKGLSLYAVWIKSAGSLQDSSKVAQLCGTGTGSLTQAPIDGTANKSSVSALTDERDNQTYAIAKLADGNCWMIENLRLDNTAELTLANTNNPLNDGTNVTLKHNYTDTDTYNTLSATSSDAYDATNAPNGWCDSNSASCDDQSRLRTDNTASRATSPTTNSNVNMYSYGNYYNWYSATAGRGTYSKSSGEVAGDLCPAGWKLPLGNTSTGDIAQGASDTANKVGGFSYLDRKMGGTGAAQFTSADSLRWRKFPLNYLYSGYVDGGSLDIRGSGGDYWSSTANNSNFAYNLYVGSSSVSPGSSNLHKYRGYAVRCIAIN